MNFQNYNILKIKYDKKNIQLLKKIFSKMSYIRQFELRAYENKLKNKFQTLIYLCLGQESIYSSVSLAVKNSASFGQHRGHGIYLANNGNPQKLVDELIGLESGTNKGMGGSPPIFDKKIGMYGHVGLIGDQVPVAAGFSLVNKNKTTICYFGDGAAEEDYVLATFGFVAQKKLKMLFICDDNDLSVLTPTKDRRAWRLTDVANSFGIKTIDITDDPLTIYYSIKKMLKKKLPALINIRTCREYWHEGAGKDNEGKNFWSRYKIIKKILEKKNETKFINKTEILHKKWSEELWEKRLQKL
jgi:TPP-dependent pyruvate/acetoin dehydrogenase alpha subunit